MPYNAGFSRVTVMSSTDQRTRFLFDSLAIRGEIVRLDNALATALAHHDYPTAVARQLAECLAAAALLTGTLKFEGQLILQAKGAGPLTLLMAECSHDGQLRGIAHHEGDCADAPLVTLLGAHDGSGHLAITIEPLAGQRYQGIVPLDGESLAECIEHYFVQSEQLNTRLWLVAEGNRAAGFLLQELPGVAAALRDEDAWNRVCRMADTLTASELLGLSVEALLHRLYHQEDVRVFPGEPLRFGCTCSRDRTLRMLASLGRTELRSILAEQGCIEVSCEFCRQKYTFTPDQMSGLLTDP